MRSTSVEEFKQIGVIIRDAWIEYSQSIFHPKFLPEGINEISPADWTVRVRRVWRGMPMLWI